MKGRINLEAKITLFIITHETAGHFRVVFNLFRLLFLQEQRSAGRVRKIQNTEYSIFVLSWLESGKCSKKEIDITVWPHFLLLVEKIFPLFCKCVAFS